MVGKFFLDNDQINYTLADNNQMVVFLITLAA